MKNKIKSIVKKEISFLLFIIISILGLIFFLALFVQIKENINNELSYETQINKVAVETRVKSIIERITNFGKNHHVVNSLISFNYDSGELKNVLSGITDSNLIKEVVITDANESIIYSSDKLLSKLNIYLSPVIHEGKTIFVKSTNSNRYFVASPILYYETPQGAILFEIDTKSLLSNKQHNISTSVNVKINDINISSNNLPISSSFFSKQLLLELDHFYDSQITLSISSDYILKPIYKFGVIFLIITFIFIYMAYIFMKNLSNKLSAPLVQLQQIIGNELNIKELNIPINGESTELKSIREELYNKACQLLENNHTLEKIVKERTGELNHALKDYEFYKSAIYNSVIILETDLNGVIIGHNKKLEDVSQYSYEEIFNKKTSIFNSDYHKREFWRNLWTTISSGKIWRGEVRNKAKDGTYYWVDIYNIPRPNNSGQIVSYLSIQSDISKSKEYEEQIKKEKEIAECATKAKSQFLATMSHEIRTPLNAILAMSDVLKESMNLTKNEFKHVKLLNSAGQTLMQLINDILDFSKIEEKKVSLEHVIFDIESIVKNTTGLFNTQANKNRIFIEVDNQLKDNNRFGDPTRIQQILFNLIGNAIKFTKDGGVTVTLSSSIKDPNKVYIEVKDTGIGIPSNKVDLIFDRFNQADLSTTRMFGGTGLGLTICKQLISIMGGEIKVNSEEDIGSTFYFDINLPIADKSKVALKTNDHLSKSEIESISGKLLIVDDSEDNIEVMKVFLSYTNIQLDTAYNGHDALELICISSDEI